MNVLVVPFSYPTPLDPGAGIFLENLCHALRREGVNVTVFYPSFVSINDLLKAPKVMGLSKSNESGCVVYRYYCPALMAMKFFKIHSFLFRKAIGIMMRKHRSTSPLEFDLIHAHSVPFGAFQVRDLAANMGVPLIITEHRRVYSENNIAPFFKRLLQICYKKSSSFIAVSQALGQNLERILGNELTKPILTIPNVVSSQFVFAEIQKKVKFEFLCVANLIEHKRVDLILKALAICCEKGFDFHLKIVGNGEQRGNLQQLSRCLGLENRIQFFGRVAPAAMQSHYQSCHVFILLSRSETFGVAYREAMFTGRPVIASRNGGIEENWETAFGYLVEQLSPKEVAKKMIKIYNQYNSFDLKYISQRNISLYGKQVVVDSLIDVYTNSILNQELPKSN